MEQFRENREPLPTAFPEITDKEAYDNERVRAYEVLGSLEQMAHRHLGNRALMRAYSDSEIYVERLTSWISFGNHVFATACSYKSYAHWYFTGFSTSPS